MVKTTHRPSRVWMLRYFYGCSVPISLPILAFRDGVGDLCMMVPGVHGPSNRDLHSRSVASAGCSG